MTKSLFDYATKELSQDGFICWLLAHHDDPALSEISYGFINLLSGDEAGFPLEVGAISDCEIERQEYKIDVIFKFKVNEEWHWLAIEDKTYSVEHNQLETYNGFLKAQNDVVVHKRYYKTAPLWKDEGERVKAAGWKIVKYETICEFFARYVAFEHSEILRDYANHVCREKVQRETDPTSPPREWNYLEWESFFNHIKERPFSNEDSTGCWVWQGRVLSYVFYYYKKSTQRLVLEFTYRKKSDHIGVAIHAAIKDKDTKGDKLSWKYLETDDGVFWKDVERRINSNPPPGFSGVRNSKGKQTMATKNEPIPIQDKDALSAEIKKVIQDFLDYFEPMM